MRPKIIFKTCLITLTAALLLVAAASTVGAQRKGGILRVAIVGEPPSLDPHWTTAGGLTTRS